MNPKIAAVALLVAPMLCVRKPPDWYAHQDRSIRVPAFDARTKLDTTIDGPTLQAIRLAAEDYAPPTSEPRACAHTQAAQLYKVSHQGDIIFVQVSRNPEACGGQGLALDAAARYAISRDGRILRRVLDGEPDNTEPEDAGEPPLSRSEELDASASFQDENPLPLGPYAPTWLLDGGSRPAGDAGAP